MLSSFLTYSNIIEYYFCLKIRFISAAWKKSINRISPKKVFFVNETRLIR